MKDIEQNNLNLLRKRIYTYIIEGNWSSLVIKGNAVLKRDDILLRKRQNNEHFVIYNSDENDRLDCPNFFDAIYIKNFFTGMNDIKFILKKVRNDLVFWKNHKKNLDITLSYILQKYDGSDYIIQNSGISTLNRGVKLDYPDQKAFKKIINILDMDKKFQAYFDQENFGNGFIRERSHYHFVKKQIGSSHELFEYAEISQKFLKQISSQNFQ